MDEKQVPLDLHEFINVKIIDFLPGIFYIYELVGRDFELIYWNANHEKVTGYSSLELRGKRVFDFFYPDDFVVIENGLTAIIEEGKAEQVNANLKLKNGETLPFLFEGYKFESGSKIYFLGVGLDVSNYTMTRRELDHVKLELNKKNKELLGFSMKNAELNEFKEELQKSFVELEKMDSLVDMKKVISGIVKKMNIDSRKIDLWEVFQLRFNEIHQDFFVKLKSRHPSLSKSELRYLAYLKIKLSGFQIATLLNVGKDAIKKKRYRIRKKLGIGSSPSLEDYIDQF